MEPRTPHTLDPQLHPPAGRVRAVERAGRRATVAAVDLEPGAVVLFVDGDLVARPSRYSVQIGTHLHVDVGNCPDTDGSSGQYVWRFLNHSCDPNAVLDGRVLLARRAIAADEEVTFDYDTNEWDMAEPFLCNCGTRRCRGWVRGFRHLSPDQQADLLPMASPHLAASALPSG